MEFPKIVTAISAEGFQGEPRLHYVRQEDGQALCGMVYILSDEPDRTDTWWPMSEPRAMHLLYRTCYDCSDAHHALNAEWVADRARRKAAAEAVPS
jgi:hypothetical protein